MADYDSALPIRSESDGTDERVHVKIVDGTTPSQRATVDTDGNLKIAAYGNRCDTAADVALVLSEQGRPNGRGDYQVDDNSCPSSSGLIAHARSATHDDTQLTQRPTAVAGASDSICLDISLHDEAGQAFSNTNPLPVAIAQSEGTEVHDYNTAASIAADATSNHNYSVANGVTFLLYGVLASASGKLKIELQIGDGAVSEAFTSKAVRFNSTANPQCDIWLFDKPISVLGTAQTTTVRVIRTNKDNQAQDVYSTIIGVNQ